MHRSLRHLETIADLFECHARLIAPVDQLRVLRRQPAHCVRYYLRSLRLHQQYTGVVAINSAGNVSNALGRCASANIDFHRGVKNDPYASGISVSDHAPELSIETGDHAVP